MVLMQYSVIANNYWLLVEGIYLHSLLVITVFSEKKFFHVYMAIGWGENLSRNVLWQSCFTKPQPVKVVISINKPAEQPCAQTEGEYSGLFHTLVNAGVSVAELLVSTYTVVQYYYFLKGVTANGDTNE